MKRLLPLLCLPLVGCPTSVPDVECAWDVPTTDGERIPSSSGFVAQISVAGSFTAEELPAVWFFVDRGDGEPVEADAVLTSGIAIETDCAAGCPAGGQVLAAVPAGSHTLAALALTPSGAIACEIERSVEVNAPPVVNSLAFDPTSPGTLQDVSLLVDASDPDGGGEAPTISATWTGPGGDTTQGDFLASIRTVAGETWSVSVTARDDFDESAPLVAEVTIANTAPDAPVARVEPQPGRDAGALRCSVETLAGLDPDLDQELTARFSWTVDGADAGIDDAVVPGSATAPGEEWQCSAVVFDGVDSSPPGTASTTILSPLSPPADIGLQGAAGTAISGHVSQMRVGDVGGVASVGDLDGDGHPEFAILTNDLINFGSGGGEVRIIRSGDSIPQSTFSATTKLVAPDGFALRTPYSAGDIDGDGFDDLVLGYRQVTGGFAHGAWVLFGSTDGWEDDGWGATTQLDAGSMDDGNSRITHIPGGSEALAESPCSVGDLDGDGFDELALAVPDDDAGAGRIYVIWGHPGNWADGLEPALQIPSFRIEGTAAGHGMGSACAGPVDLDLDGLDDLVMGAPGGGLAGGGRVIIWLSDGDRPVGSLTSPSAQVLIDAVDGSPGGLGSSMAVLGDHDGDAFPDIAVFGNGATADNEGAVWIISGGDPGLDGAIRTSALPHRIDGAAGLGFCRRMTGVDLDGDGLGDLACGDTAPEYAQTLAGTVAARVFLGSADLGATRSWTDADVLLLPVQGYTEGDMGEVQAGDGPGASLAGLADRNGDDYDELLVGSPGRDDSGTDSGTVTLIDLND